MAIGALSRSAATTAGRAAAVRPSSSSLPRVAAAEPTVGCSYRQQVRPQPQPQPQRRREMAAAGGAQTRTFSTTRPAPFLEGVRNVFSGLRDRGKKAVGMKTAEDERLELYMEELEPNAAKSRKRLERKRWSRPAVVTDEGTGETRDLYTEHKFSTARFRISPRKLQMLAHQIGEGKPLDYAIVQMQFSHKRAASRVKSMLALARDHAIAKGMDPAKLVVAEAWVGKGRTHKKIEFKGRGRIGVVTSPQAHMSVVLREGKTYDEKLDAKMKKEKRIVRSIGTGGVVRTNRPIVNSHQRAGWQW